MKKIPLVHAPRFYRSMLIIMGSAFLSLSVVEATYTRPVPMTLSPVKGAYDQLSDSDKKAFMELVHNANVLELDANDYKITDGIIYLARPFPFYETYSKFYDDPAVTFFVSFKSLRPGKRGIGPETERFLKDFFKDAGVFVSEKPGQVIEINGGSSEVKDTFLTETYHLRIKSHISILAVKPRTGFSDAAHSTFIRHGLDLDYAVKTFIQTPASRRLEGEKEEPPSLDRPWLKSKPYLPHHPKRFPSDTFVVPEAKDVLEDTRAHPQ